jgi:hypothetical protein
MVLCAKHETTSCAGGDILLLGLADDALSPCKHGVTCFQACRVAQPYLPDSFGRDPDRGHGVTALP